MKAIVSPAHPGALLARQLHNRLPDWHTAPSGVDAVELLDPAGVWTLHVYDSGEVTLHQRGELAGVLHRPDPGALAAFLTAAASRAQATKRSTVDGYPVGGRGIPRQRIGSAVTP